MLGLRFEGGMKGDVAVKRSILGSPDGYAQFMDLKKRIDIPEPIKKKAKTQGLGLTPKSLLGHSTIPNSHDS